MGSKRDMVLIAVWGAIVCALAGWQMQRSTLAGPAAPAPAAWDAESAAGRLVRRSPGRMLVVAGLHPKCPCAEATIGELSDLAERFGLEVDLVILAVLPRGAPESWLGDRVCREARGIAHASVVVDRGGVAAASLGMTTSGHVLVVGPTGRTLFSGGITPVRGERGPNPGLSAVEGLLGQRGAGASERGMGRAPVLGCRLSEELCGPGAAGGEGGER